jgi:hypothetical protein
MCVCVCDCLKIEQPPRASVYGRVNWSNIRVHIWQTSTQVVVQRCGLTSDRKACTSPPPTKSVHVDFNMYESGIRLQEYITTCTTQDT